MKVEVGLLIALVALGMLVFGLPGGVLAIAWPSMSDSFGVAVTSLGGVIAVFTATYTVASFVSGWFLRNVGLGVFLAVSATVMGSSFVAYAVVPEWWMLLVVAGGAGAGGGSLDAGLNIFAAVNLSARLTNWVHAFFSLGTLVGSTAMTGLLVIGAGWQWGYVIVGGAFAALVIGFAATRTRWHSGQAHSASVVGVAGLLDTLRLPAAWMGITAFGLYTALEVAAGVWSFTLLTEGRGLSVAAAGGWVSAYFGGLVAGRLVLGAFAGTVSLTHLLRFSSVLSVVGAVAFWQVQVNELNCVGLVLLGFGLGPIFPTLISATPSFVGAKHTPNAIGFQTAAAALGGGLLPAGVGFIAAATDLEAISVSLVFGSVLLLAVLWIFTTSQPGSDSTPAHGAPRPRQPGDGH